MQPVSKQMMSSWNRGVLCALWLRMEAAQVSCQQTDYYQMLFSVTVQYINPPAPKVSEGAQGVIIRMAQTTVRYRFTWCFCENNGFLIGRDGGFQKKTVFLQHGFDYIVRARARPEPATEKLKKHVWF